MHGQTRYSSVLTLSYWRPSPPFPQEKARTDSDRDVNLPSCHPDHSLISHQVSRDLLLIFSNRHGQEPRAKASHAQYQNMAFRPKTYSHSAPRKPRLQPIFSESRLVVKRPEAEETCRQQAGARSQSVPWEGPRQARPPAIAVCRVPHCPLLQADAAPLGLVRLSKPSVPTAMAGDAGTVGLAVVWDTLSGRRPLSRGAAVCAPHHTARLFGTAIPPQAVPDETGGRVLERLSDVGPRRRCTACAVRAARRVGWERRAGPCAPPSRRVWGASQ